MQLKAIAKAIAKAAGGVICAFFGFICCFGDQIIPSYKTIEVSPGVVEEQWMSAQDLWIGIAFGVAFFALGGYLLWSAYRTFRQAHKP